MTDPWAAPDDRRQPERQRGPVVRENLRLVGRNLWWILPVFVLLCILAYNMLVGLWLYLNDPT